MFPVPIGIDQFDKIREKGNIFVDKSLFIRDVINHPAEALLITRPRRFWKSLNLSMLRCFFDRNMDAKELFKGLAIAQESEACWKHSNQYPVIGWSLKEIRGLSFDQALDLIKTEVATLYGQFKHELLPHLEAERQVTYEKIVNKSASHGDLALALRSLTADLHHVHGQPVVVLIDEYDTPFHAAYLGGYYSELLEIMRSILSSTLKGNPHLEKAVVTGVLRVAKESLFSGLNNVFVDTVLRPCFTDYFGFTEGEVINVLHQADRGDELASIKQWYNGYRIGDHLLYNPWSVWVSLRQGLGAHWVNTASTELIERVLAHSGSDVKIAFESLLAGQDIEAHVEDQIVFQELSYSSDHVWGQLLAAGYLTCVQPPKAQSLATLRLPNLEIQTLFEKIIRRWFKGALYGVSLKYTLDALTAGDQDVFQAMLSTICLESLSYFDASGHEPEKVYHAFVLGLVMALRDNYQIKSNRESGYGRYDLVLCPKNSSCPGIIMEFKRALPGKSLHEAAERALEQIQVCQYHTELFQSGVGQVVAWAVAFRGKEVHVRCIHLSHSQSSD